MVDWIPKRFRRQFSYSFESLVTALLQLVDDINLAFQSNPPVGTMTPFAGDVAPAGYLLCNGDSYLVAEYPTLFAKIQYTFGGAGGNFNVPDATDRMFMGAGGAYALGVSGGAASHALIKAELPSYSLTVTDPGHNHTQNAHTHVQNAHNHTQNAHTHIQDTHNHTQNSHNHTQNAHTHVQNSHNHDQDPHNHTQSSHNHTQNSHNHTQSAHNHTERGGTAAGGTTTRPLVGNYAPVADAISTGDETAVNVATTATNIAATAVNLATTATNQTEVAVNQNTTATNNAATATNNATIATNQATVATNIAATAVNQNTTAVNISNTTGISVASGGSGQPISLLPPFLAINYIIRY